MEHDLSLSLAVLAYDPTNKRFQTIANFFWKHYSKENGSWRDQPLWAYTLYHFNVTPMVLTSEGNIERGGDLFRPGGRMGWKGHVYGETTTTTTTSTEPENPTSNNTTGSTTANNTNNNNSTNTRTQPKRR